jgi:23S rRNA (cytidine1920-2'-O)/16S rRNA (cytidine1409-2'-O)-methyltransferase
MAKSEKVRLDILLVNLGLAETRSKAQGLIMAGDVKVDGNTVDKAGTAIAITSEITVRERSRYVSRGGEKLEGALRDFAYNPNGKIVADVGASTGGFTDCLLQHGATKVYAIDVGYGLLAQKLRSDERVIPIERTNARYLETLPEPIDLVVVDASFISLKILLKPVAGWLKPEADVIALIKPQFEAGRDDIGKGGVVREQEVHRRVIQEVIEFASTLNFGLLGLTRSPIKGPAGNVEFLVWLGGQRPSQLSLDDALASLLP